MFAYALHVNDCWHDDWRCNPRSYWRAMAAGEGRGGHRGGGRGRERGFGREGFEFGFGPGGGRFGRGRKARRGDIRTAALLLLVEEPRNGYQIMQEVQERSGGMWRPSPGSVYPALQQLEDEGLIRSSAGGSEQTGKVFELTEAGRAYLAERKAEAVAPWEQMSSDVGEKAVALAGLMREVAFAFRQVMHAGSERQMEQAGKVLVAARRDLYRILADGDPQTDDDSSTEG
jgi:DNA-binding PadR family transcriptional regulator